MDIVNASVFSVQDFDGRSAAWVLGLRDGQRGSGIRTRQCGHGYCLGGLDIQILRFLRTCAVNRAWVPRFSRCRHIDATDGLVLVFAIFDTVLRTVVWLDMLIC